jgi:phosphoribosylamine--glycine ligase
MKVLIVGGGGREHALAWKLNRDDPSVQLVAAPGNPGIAKLARCVRVAAHDIDALVQLAEAERPDLTVVGPEGPLADGIVDRFRQRRMPIFGPTAGAARIESSKAFAKSLMMEAGVPTARATSHVDVQSARRAVRELGVPVVIKVSGLAAGKGVVVAETLADADGAIDAMLTDALFGQAGAEVLVEEFMAGEEMSLLVVTNGEDWVPLVPAQDHKRLLNGDRGPNTGGMGAFAPAIPPFSAGGRQPPGESPGRELMARLDALIEIAGDRIITPTLAALRAKGHPFNGVLYAGLMLTDAGPRVVEFNSRLGDPEAQAILPVTRQPLLPLLQAAAAGEALPRGTGGQLVPECCVTTVVASAGYPGQPRVGDLILLPADEPGIHIFHAGTARNAEGKLVTAGGRVLAVTAVAADLAGAQRASVDFAARVDFTGKQFRTDIAWRGIARLARAT